MQDHMTDHEREAYELGAEHARNAASWAVDGNTAQDAIRRVVAMFDEGDPEGFFYLPTEPNLSGEWADDLTPRRLWATIVEGDEAADDPDGDSLDALCDAYEAGVHDTFESECERVFREALS